MSVCVCVFFFFSSFFLFFLFFCLFVCLFVWLVGWLGGCLFVCLFVCVCLFLLCDSSYCTLCMLPSRYKRLEAASRKLQQPFPASKTHVALADAVPHRERCTSEAASSCNSNAEFARINPRATPRTQTNCNFGPTARQRHNATSSTKG